MTTSFRVVSFWFGNQKILTSGGLFYLILYFILDKSENGEYINKPHKKKKEEFGREYLTSYQKRYL
jgi:hypothetical protein